MSVAPEPLPGARLLFSLDPGQAYLNHGTVGVTPVPVQRAHQRLRDEVEANPQRFFTRGLHDRVAHARRHLAAFVGADPDGSALVPNTTFGIATVLRTLGLGTGDEVVTTDHGYGSVDYAVDATGAHRRVVPLGLTAGDDEIVAGIRAEGNPIGFDESKLSKYTFCAVQFANGKVVKKEVKKGKDFKQGGGMGGTNPFAPRR